MSEDLVQKIKNALSIEDVVGEYIEVKKSGRVYKALCPFHKEKTPSFIITPEKGLAYCFGCHTGGDIFEFVQKIENVDFIESIKILAKKAGIEVDESQFTTEEKTKKTILFEFHKRMTELYQKELLLSDTALDYLKVRGLTEKSIRDFDIGYAPSSWDFAKKEAEKLSLSEEEMLDYGAFVKNEDGKLYDRFRNRIMFPLKNMSGGIVGFSGRTLDQQENAKYVNSSESPLFSKKTLLFGLDLAKQKIRELNYIIIMEGQMDVILAHQVGCKHIVGCSGTAFTEDHLKIISHFTNNIVFCFDADTAGLNATKKATELALSKGFGVKIITLSAGKDAAEIITHKGDSAFLEEIQHAYKPIEFYYNTLKNQHNLETLEGKKRFIEEIAPLLQITVSHIERTDIIQFLELKTHMREDDIRFEVSRLKNTFLQNKKNISPALSKPNLIEQIFALIVSYPYCLEYAEKLDNIVSLLSEKWKNIYKEIKEYYNLKHEKINTFNPILSIQETHIPKLSVFFDEKYQDWENEDVIAEFTRFIDQFKKTHIKQKLLDITIEMKKAEQEGNREVIESLGKEQNNLMEQLQEKE